jgi:hypothetical protein
MIFCSVLKWKLCRSSDNLFQRFASVILSWMWQLKALASLYDHSDYVFSRCELIWDIWENISGVVCVPYSFNLKKVWSIAYIYFLCCFHSAMKNLFILNSFLIDIIWIYRQNYFITDILCFHLLFFLYWFLFGLTFILFLLFTTYTIAHLYVSIWFIIYILK